MFVTMRLGSWSHVSTLRAVRTRTRAQTRTRGGTDGRCPGTITGSVSLTGDSGPWNRELVEVGRLEAESHRSRSARKPAWVDVGSLLLVMGRQNRNNGRITLVEKLPTRNFRRIDWLSSSWRFARGPASLTSSKRTNFRQESSVHALPIFTNIHQYSHIITHSHPPSTLSWISQLHPQSDFQLFDVFGNPSRRRPSQHNHPTTTSKHKSRAENVILSSPCCI